ncbi:MAG: aromatic amino acid lyase, partial [Actinomycetota bacterium]|nr:aromatic amino acid lyase [Actinomycetota bacterium]
MQAVVEVEVGPVAPADVVSIARDGARVRLAPDAVTAMQHAREAVEALAGDTLPHYGISTGFGAMATTHIPVER